MFKKAYQLDSLVRLFFGAKTTLGVFAHKSTAAIACRVASMVLWFALQALLIRNMGLAVYGEYVYVLAWATSLAEIGTLGMDKVVLRFGAEYHARKEYAQLFGIIRYTTRLACFVGSLLAMMLAGAVSFSETNATGDHRTCFWIAAFIIPLMAVILISESCLRSLGHIIQGLSSSLAIPAVLCLTVLFLTSNSIDGLSSATVMSIHLAAVAISLTIVLRFCHYSKQKIATIEPSEKERPQWNAMAVPMFFMTFQNAVQGQCGILLCGFFLGTAEAGIYGLMARIAALLGFGLQTINLVAAPMFAKLHASGKKQELQNLAHMCAWVSTLFSLVAGAGILLYWDSIERLFGTSLDAGMLTLSILLVGAIINATAGSVGYLLLMSGNHTICVKVLSLGTLLNVTLSVVLIPSYGIVGAAIAQAITMSLWNIALIYYVRKRMSIWSVLGRVTLAIP